MSEPIKMWYTVSRDGIPVRIRADKISVYSMRLSDQTISVRLFGLDTQLTVTFKDVGACQEAFDRLDCIFSLV